MWFFNLGRSILIKVDVCKQKLPGLLSTVLILLFNSISNLPALEDLSIEPVIGEVSELITLGAEEILEEEPAPPPPDPLTSSEIASRISTLLPAGVWPIHREGRPFTISHDLDSNGYNDIFLVTIAAGDEADADFGAISDYSRLFDPDPTEMEFILRCYLQLDGDLQAHQTQSLGPRIVFDSFIPRSIVEGMNDPFAVSLGFQTLKGPVKEWLIFSQGDLTRFTLEERLGVVPEIGDIDEDGIVDVVIYDEDYEVGVGHETYLTWYRWDGSRFVEFKTTNVVRNLNRFLKESLDNVGKDRWSRFVEVALPPVQVELLRGEGVSDFEIFSMLFRPVDPGESFRSEPLESGIQVRRAVYPDIFENPFSQRDSGGAFFTLTVRFETAERRNFLYTSRVYMRKNPFQERQFIFAVLSPL